MMYNLPKPRSSFYQYSDIDRINEAVFSEVNDALNALGFFTINTGMPLLKNLNSLSMPFLYIGMVANLVVIMLVIIAILLIYSLLMISIEKKTF